MGTHVALGTLAASIAIPTAASSWGHRLGPWASGKTMQHTKGVTENKGGPLGMPAEGAAPQALPSSLQQ